MKLCPLALWHEPKKLGTFCKIPRLLTQARTHAVARRCRDPDLMASRGKEGAAHSGPGGAPRGARHSASARSVVRVAQRVIRREDWGSFEITVSHDGDVTLRVERSASSTASPPGRPNSRRSTVADLGKADARSHLTKKEKKALQCQRRGILSRFVLGGSSGLLARRVVRRAWARLLEGADHVAAPESPAAHARATHPMEADPSPAPAAAVAPASVQPASARSPAATSPARTRTASTKRPTASPGKGKKSGRRS